MTIKPKKLKPARKPKRKAKLNEKPEFENDPTPERIRHARDQVDAFKTDSGRTVKRLNAILDHMLSRGLIDKPLYEAGWMAYGQYLGSLAPSGTVDTSKERVDGSSSGDPMQRRIDNRRKHDAAMAALAKPHRLAFVVMVENEINVAVFGLEYYGYRDVALARAVSYSILKDALAQLVEHYSGGQMKSEHVGIRAHMSEGGKATNRTDIREKVA